MNTEITREVLARLNERLTRKKQNILQFLDNALCHPPGIGDNAPIKSKLQHPLPPGI